MIRSQLQNSREDDPTWGFVAQLGAERFTGEVQLGSTPRVRLYVDEGAIYFAERDGDSPLQSRLVVRGPLSPARQLARGGVFVDGSASGIARACSAATAASIATRSRSLWNESPRTCSTKWARCPWAACSSRHCGTTTRVSTSGPAASNRRPSPLGSRCPRSRHRRHRRPLSRSPLSRSPPPATTPPAITPLSVAPGPRRT